MGCSNYGGKVKPETNCNFDQLELGLELESTYFWQLVESEPETLSEAESEHFPGVIVGIKG